jgi:hypothetical protein
MRDRVAAAAGDAVAVDAAAAALAGNAKWLEQACYHVMEARWDEPQQEERIRGAVDDANLALPVIEKGIRPQCRGCTCAPWEARNMRSSERIGHERQSDIGRHCRTWFSFYAKILRDSSPARTTASGPLPPYLRLIWARRRFRLVGRTRFANSMRLPTEEMQLTVQKRMAADIY